MTAGHSTSDNANNNGQQASLADHFLLAMPNLTEGIFSQSVTYLCDHGEHGAMGIVINHPLELTVSEIFEHLSIRCLGEYEKEQVLAGGPVQIDHGFVLHRGGRGDWESTMAVTDEIGLTASRDILTAIARGEGPEEHLIALGYAGWAPGQLESELAQNSWLTLPADGEIIFHTPYQQRLSAAASRLGVDMNLISSTAGHA
ncbi:MAG: YqgE/AlgH family protein [Pseudomonadota bacterium]